MQQSTPTQSAPPGLVEGARKEFALCVRRVFLELARQAYHNKKMSREAVASPILGCYQKFFDSMKGATNLSKTDIWNAAREELARQRQFFERLEQLKEHFNKIGIDYEIREPTKNNPTSWQHGLSAGCTLRILNIKAIKVGNDVIPFPASLYAFPLTEAEGPYDVAQRDPIVYLDEQVVICIPKSKISDENTYLELKQQLAVPELDLQNDFPFEQEEPGFFKKLLGKKPPQISRRAELYKNFVLLDLPESPDREDALDLLKKYDVNAVIIANREKNKTTIITGQQTEPFPREPFLHMNTHSRKP
ncbi:hypothetical protein GF342_06120 [Candidatus Woesearchaeota archaeon]|nr:hypothetical protein [Candidatus Woesearchaeota archaeon]